MNRVRSPLRWFAICLLAGGCSVLALSSTHDDAEGEQPKEECAKPAGGPLVSASSAQAPAPVAAPVSMPMARVGQKAPDFEASAFVGGKFKNVKLSDHAGKWVVLCFYPGDFTFV